MPAIIENHEPKYFRNRAVFVHCDDASGMEEPAAGSNFYHTSVNENYLRKSELIAKHLSQIGIGKRVETRLPFRY